MNPLSKPLAQGGKRSDAAQIKVRMTEELMARVRKVAERHDRTITYVINHAVREFVEYQERLDEQQPT